MAEHSAQEVYALVKAEQYLQALDLAEELVNSEDADLSAYKAGVHALYQALCRAPDQCRDRLQPALVQKLQDGLNRCLGCDYLDFFKSRSPDPYSSHEFVDSLDGCIAAKLKQLIINLKRPNAAEVLEAEHFVRLKDHYQAYLCYTRALEKGPLTKYEEQSFALTLERLCSAALSLREKYQYVVDYLKLTQVDKPSVLNSMMLQHADELCEYPELDYAAYLEVFNLDTLLPTDYAAASYTLEDGRTTSCSSLYGRVLINALKNARGRLKERQTVYQPALEALIKRAEHFNQETLSAPGAPGYRKWVLYYLAWLLCELKRGSEALPTAMEFARQEQGYESSWALLAECFLQTAKEHQALCCLCRSLQLKDETLEKLNLSQCLKAAVLLKQSGDEGLAGELADLAGFMIKQNGGSSELFADFCREQAAWYEPLARTELSSFEPLRTELLALGTEACGLLYPDLKLHHACIGAPGEIAHKDGSVRRIRNVYVCLKEGRWPVDLICDAHKAEIFKDGEAVDVRIKPDPPASGRWSKIVSLQRGQHSTDEVMIYKTAAVTYVNQQLQRYHVIFEDGSCSFVFMDRVEGDLNVGDCVQVQMAKSSKKDRELLLCMNCRPATDRPEALFRSADTVITAITRSGLALTKEGITIGEAMMQEQGLSAGAAVRVEAVLSFNHRRGAYSWSAYKVQPIRSTGKNAGKSTSKSAAKSAGSSSWRSTGRNAQRRPSARKVKF